jgi:hypothetical protein
MRWWLESSAVFNARIFPFGLEIINMAIFLYYVDYSLARKGGYV